MIQASGHAPEQGSARCSFCRKSEAEGGRLIEGPGLDDEIPVFICAACVDLCSMILEGQKQRMESVEEPDDQAPTSTAAVGQQIDQVLKNLTDLERRVVKLRYGLENGYSYSLEEVGRDLEITPEQVLEIEGGAVAKLKANRE